MAPSKYFRQTNRNLQTSAIMKRQKAEEIIYAINVSDLQEVSTEVLERRPTKKEVASVSGSVGNYIDWFQAIEHAIYENIRE